MGGTTSLKQLELLKPYTKEMDLAGQTTHDHQQTFDWSTVKDGQAQTSLKPIDGATLRVDGTQRYDGKGQVIRRYRLLLTSMHAINTIVDVHASLLKNSSPRRQCKWLINFDWVSHAKAFLLRSHACVDT